VKTNKLIFNLVMAGLLSSNVAMSAQTQPSGTVAQPQQNQAQQKLVVLTDNGGPKKSQIESIVHDYILSNPDVIVQALQSFQQKQMEKARETIVQTQKKSPQYVDALFHQAADPVVGNQQGTITVVEFFDYQCPHCVDMADIMDKLVISNPNVRVVYKEFPIRGPVSVFAAKAALAAKNQGKYIEFHKALMNTKQQPLTNESILQIAQSVGLDADQLKKDMNNPAVDQQIKSTYKLAQDLELIGTPAFFIGKTTLVGKNAKSSDIVFIPGQVDQSQLEDMIKKIS